MLSVLSTKLIALDIMSIKTITFCYMLHYFTEFQFILFQVLWFICQKYQIMYLLYFIFRAKPLPEAKLWDVFRNPPPQLSSASMANKKRLGTATKILKMVVYLVTFVTVLGCGVLIKGTTLFMTSQIKKGKEVVYCNKGLGKLF